VVPEFAGSNPAEAVAFLTSVKNPQHAFLRRRRRKKKKKRNLSHVPTLRHVKEPTYLCKLLDR
jgi:hypothetical protein